MQISKKELTQAFKIWHKDTQENPENYLTADETFDTDPRDYAKAAAHKIFDVINNKKR